MGGFKKLKRLVTSIGKRRSFALNELDLKLERYIDFDNGFFVEAGANDGVQQSNTLYFEKYRNWRGLLVEPIPDLADRCRRQRRRSAVENAALVPIGYRETDVEMRSCGLMSVVKGAMKSESEELEHVSKGCQLQAIETRELRVRARPLSEILDEHDITHIDLLSLDVEGFELQALRGLDFARHRPTYMLVEARYREEIDDHLLPLYEPIDEPTFRDVLYKLRAA